MFSVEFFKVLMLAIVDLMIAIVSINSGIFIDFEGILPGYSYLTDCTVLSGRLQ